MTSLSKLLLASAVLICGLAAVSPVLAQGNLSAPEAINAPVTAILVKQAPKIAASSHQLIENFSSVSLDLEKDWEGAQVQARLDSFAATVSNGSASQVTGLFVDGVLADKVTGQPAGNPGYVTTNENELSQFGMAAQYGSLAFLGHNTIAGAAFFDLSEGQVITLVYGDGSTADYQVQSIYHFQALSPTSPTSNFVDLDGGGQTLSASDLFYQMYNSDHPVVLQTCIANEGISSWGRLFVIAVPLS